MGAWGVGLRGEHGEWGWGGCMGAGMELGWVDGAQGVGSLDGVLSLFWKADLHWSTRSNTGGRNGPLAISMFGL